MREDRGKVKERVEDERGGERGATLKLMWTCESRARTLFYRQSHFQIKSENWKHALDMTKWLVWFSMFWTSKVPSPSSSVLPTRETDSSYLKHTWYVGFVFPERERWFIPAVSGCSISPVAMGTGAAASWTGETGISPKVEKYDIQV